MPTPSSIPTPFIVPLDYDLLRESIRKEAVEMSAACQACVTDGPLQAAASEYVDQLSDVTARVGEILSEEGITRRVMHGMLALCTPEAQAAVMGTSISQAGKLTSDMELEEALDNDPARLAASQQNFTAIRSALHGIFIHGYRCAQRDMLGRTGRTGRTGGRN